MTSTNDSGRPTDDSACSTAASTGPGDSTRPADTRRRTGRSAEDLCARQLRRRGWQILARNWRIKPGELDLIARSGQTLVVVEVKSTHTHLRAGPLTPALAVNAKKQRRIRLLAEAWLAGPGRHLPIEDVRFDVVGILFDRDGNVAEYEHIENAF